MKYVQGEIIQRKISGGNFLEGNCPGAFFQGEMSWYHKNVGYKRLKEISKDQNMVNKLCRDKLYKWLYKGLKKAFLSFSWRCGAKKNMDLFC